MDGNKIIRTALAVFGAEKQRIKCIEELSELAKELCKDAIGDGNTFHIAEEIADCEITLEQMKICYNCQSVVDMFKIRKLDRLAKRLNIGNYDE